MIRIIDLKLDKPVKSGFPSLAKANQWAKKNLPNDQVHFWGKKAPWSYRYYIQC